jgi:competence protein ComGC
MTDRIMRVVRKNGNTKDKVVARISNTDDEAFVEVMERAMTIYDLAKKGEVKAFAFAAIHTDGVTTGYTPSCADDCFVALGAIETLKQRFVEEVVLS